MTDKAYVGEPSVSFEQEADVLKALLAIFAGPYMCIGCGNRFTTEWKPRIYLLCGEEGVKRVIVDLLCMACFATAKSIEE